MKTLLTAANLFLAIFFTVRFFQLIPIPHEVSADINFYIFRLVAFALIAILNIYYVINFIKEK